MTEPNYPALLKKITTEHPDIPFIILDGLEESITGVIEDEGMLSLTYSHEKIIELLQQEQGMEYWEAREWFDFNIECLGQFEHGPYFIYREEE